MLVLVLLSWRDKLGGLSARLRWSFGGKRRELEVEVGFGRVVIVIMDRLDSSEIAVIDLDPESRKRAQNGYVNAKRFIPGQ